MVPGSGTTEPPPKLDAGLPRPDDLPAPSPPLKEPLVAPLLKVTEAPSPMVSELRVWLTLPNFRDVPVPFTVTAAVSDVRLPFTLVVPALAVSVL